MRKTSVYLTAEEVGRLGILAEREGTSQAEVIRRAIKAYEPERRGGREFSLVGVAEGPGGSIADLTEAELLEGFGS
jgi:predicted transcriptional regulator